MKKDSLFDSVLENSVNTGLKTNFENAITNAGVRIPSGTCMWEYPDIIRKNLISKTVTGINIIGGDVINIDTSSDGDVLTYKISTSFDSFNTSRPNYAWKNSKWGQELTVENVFNDLFENILPAVRGVHAGDMTISNTKGEDTKEWNNTLFNKTGFKTGLEPTTRYIRLYLTCQAEPIYISLGNLIEEITGGYKLKNSDTVSFLIDDNDTTITAHINVINDNQLKELGIEDIESVIEQ